MRKGACETLQADKIEGFVDFVSVRTQEATGFEAQRGILPYGAPGIERRILEYDDA
jgi:hypothetical protein